MLTMLTQPPLPHPPKRAHCTINRQKQVLWSLLSYKQKGGALLYDNEDGVVKGRLILLKTTRLTIKPATIWLLCFSTTGEIFLTPP